MKKILALFFVLVFSVVFLNAQPMVGPRSFTNQNVLRVVSQGGSDTTGARNKFDRPYATIGAAITNAQNGDLILIGPGDYTVTPGISVAAGTVPIFLGELTNVTVAGVGMYSTRINYTGPGDIFYVRRCNGITFKDFSVIGNGASLTNNVLYAAFYQRSNTVHTTYENIRIVDAPDHGISTPTGDKDCNNIKIINCHFEDIGDANYSALSVNDTQVTGIPNAGDTLAIGYLANNGAASATDTRTWAVAGSSTDIVIGADANESATNLFNHYTYTNAISWITPEMTAADTVRFTTTTYIERLTNDVTGAWATDDYTVNNADGAAISGIGNHWIIRGCTFTNNLRDIEWEAIANANDLIGNTIVSDCYFTGTQNYVFWFVPYAAAHGNFGNITIQNCVVTNMNDSTGPHAGNVPDATVVATGSPGYNFSFVNNTVSRVANSAAATSGNGLKLLSAAIYGRNWRIVGNTFDRVDNQAIWVAPSTYYLTNVVIGNNVFDRCQSPITASANGMSIVGNTITDFGYLLSDGSGIWIDGTAKSSQAATNVIVTGNTIIQLEALTELRYGIRIGSGVVGVRIGPNVFSVKSNYWDQGATDLRYGVPLEGTINPEGAYTAPVGTFYIDTDAVYSDNVYIKTNGTGNTGWTTLSGAQ